MTRQLAHRNDGAIQIHLFWREVDGRNFTFLRVYNDETGNEFIHDVLPERAWHAFTHTGAYVPEAFNRELQAA